MPHVWDADVQIDAEVASRLIRSQFPELEIRALRLFGEGWDNAAFLLNDELLFRFPRRKVAAALISAECQILPILKDHLPLSIPVPLYEGQSEGDYIYPFAGYRILPGESACKVSWDTRQKLSNAEALGRFLGALHQIEVDDNHRAWAPTDTIRRADLPFRLQRTKQLIRDRPECFQDRSLDEHLALMETLSETPAHSGSTCWLHGDLYDCHLLAEDHQVTGVIDWGDVHLGDPAIDISIAFSWLPPEARSLFLESYGGVDSNTWNRARSRALNYGFTFLWYGQEMDRQDTVDIAGFILDNAARD